VLVERFELAHRHADDARVLPVHCKRAICTSLRGRGPRLMQSHFHHVVRCVAQTERRCTRTRVTRTGTHACRTRGRAHALHECMQHMRVRAGAPRMLGHPVPKIQRSAKLAISRRKPPTWLTCFRNAADESAQGTGAVSAAAGTAAAVAAAAAAAGRALAGSGMGSRRAATAACTRLRTIGRNASEPHLLSSVSTMAVAFMRSNSVQCRLSMRLCMSSGVWAAARHDSGGRSPLSAATTCAQAALCQARSSSSDIKPPAR
jgi:hypothetical protein